MEAGTAPCCVYVIVVAAAAARVWSLDLGVNRAEKGVCCSVSDAGGDCFDS